jgi:hypothetical protein
MLGHPSRRRRRQLSMLLRAAGAGPALPAPAPARLRHLAISPPPPPPPLPAPRRALPAVRGQAVHHGQRGRVPQVPQRAHLHDRWVGGALQAPAGAACLCGTGAAGAPAGSAQLSAGGSRMCGCSLHAQLCALRPAHARRQCGRCPAPARGPAGRQASGRALAGNGLPPCRPDPKLHAASAGKQLKGGAWGDPPHFIAPIVGMGLPGQGQGGGGGGGGGVARADTGLRGPRGYSSSAAAGGLPGQALQRGLLLGWLVGALAGALEPQRSLAGKEARVLLLKGVEASMESAVRQRWHTGWGNAVTYR